MYFVYLVVCADSTLYAGVTTDLTRRLTEHNTSTKGAKYTHARRPVQLVYSKKYKTRGAAQKAEAQIKKLSRAAKLALIKNKSL